MTNKRGNVRRILEDTQVIGNPDHRRQARLEELFLTTLSRTPTDEETGRFSEFVANQDDTASAYEDVFWVLANSTEFYFNH